ncbi:MAG: FAD-binding oxidoreductase [Ferrimicrobium sp.]
MVATPEVVTPESLEELSAILADCGSNQRVEIVGAGSNPGPVPDRPITIRLSMANFRLLEHRVDDLTVTVGAGVRFSELQRQLGDHGQRIALDPPGDGTIGGLVATSAHGPLVYRFGGVRDQVIGMTFVLADGSVGHSGGKVIKNVAGYDVSKLLVGSRGTLAVVTEATFRTVALPEATATVVGSAQDGSRLRLIETIIASGTDPVAIECVRGSWMVVFEGTVRGVDAQVRRLSEAVAPFGGSTRLELDDSRSLWERVSVDRTPGVGELAARIYARTARIDSVYEALQGTPFVSSIRLSSHAGSGLHDVVVESKAPGIVVDQLEQVMRGLGLQTLLRAGKVQLAVETGFFPAIVPTALERLLSAFDPLRIFGAKR